MAGRGFSDNSIHVEGLAPLQRALKKAEGETGKQLRRELRAIANDVRDAAKSNAPKRSGALAGGVKSSVTQRGASVYSNLVYAYVQDRGGQVGRNRATLLRRSDVSQYMTRAVQREAPRVQRRMERVLDRIGRDF